MAPWDNNRPKGALYWALHDAIKRAGLPCFAVIDGASVRLANDRLVEPDVLVYCGEHGARNVLEVPNPIIIVEVLSLSTASHDLTFKFENYFALPSLHHLLLINADKPLLIQHTRGAGDAIETRFAREPVLRLDPPGLEVEVGEVLDQSGRG